MTTSAGVTVQRRCNESVLRYLRTLTTWHCSHSAVATAAIDRYLVPSNKPKPAAGLLLWAHAGTRGSFPVRKRTGTLRIWQAREREPIWGSEGGAPSGVQGQSLWSEGKGGEAPLKLKAFYCRREQICHSHLSET